MTAENAIVDPSGDQSILLPTPLAGFVSRRTWLPFAARRRSRPCLRRACGERRCACHRARTSASRCPRRRGSSGALLPSARRDLEASGMRPEDLAAVGRPGRLPVQARQAHPVQAAAVRVHREDVEMLLARPLGVVARERDPLPVGRPRCVQRVAVGQVRDLVPAVAVGPDREELGVLADLGLVGEQPVGAAIGRTRRCDCQHERAESGAEERACTSRCPHHDLSFRVAHFLGRG